MVLTSIIYGYMMTKKWDAGYTTNGFLAGLVAITCPCYWVSPTGAVLLGGIAGVLVILGVDLLRRNTCESTTRLAQYLCMDSAAFGNIVARPFCSRQIRRKRTHRAGQLSPA